MRFKNFLKFLVCMYARCVFAFSNTHYTHYATQHEHTIQGSNIEYNKHLLAGVLT